MIRTFLGTLAGLSAAIGVIALVQMISSALYPMPLSVREGGPEAMKAWINTLPIGAFLVLLLAYLSGSFVGGYVSTWLSKVYPTPAFVVSSLLTIFGILTQISIPQPFWQSVLIIICFLPMTLLGARVALRSIQ